MTRPPHIFEKQNGRSPPPTDTDITFFIVDDHPVVTFALGKLIEGQPGWSVAGKASSPRDALEALHTRPPRMLILDLLFPSQSGLDSLARLHDAMPETFITVYTVQPLEVYGLKCLKAGARAFVRKDAPVELFLRALRSVSAGGLWLGDRPWGGPGESAGCRGRRDDSLSPRELEVLELLAQGLTSREMAASLCRSVKTIETHRHRLSRKLGLRSGAELMRYAIHHLEGGAASGSQCVGAIVHQSMPSGVRARKDHE